MMDNPYYERLVNAAIRFVSYRPRSEKEIRDFLTRKLTKWKVSGEVLLQNVITRMRELGYIDDEKFAQWWIEQRSTFRPKGKRLLEMELRAKGVSMKIDIDEGALAKRAIEKKRVHWDKKKLYGFLMRRGFSSSVVDDIVKNGV